MIRHGVCYSYLLEIPQGLHTASDRYAVALYGAEANVGPETKSYTPAGEVIGPGYSPGGLVLNGFSATLVGRESCIGFTGPAVWSHCSIKARGAMIYNMSKQNKAVAVVDFGEDHASRNGPFTVELPCGSEAVIRIG